MTVKSDRIDVAELVRRQGVPQGAQVDPLVSEIRSCLVSSGPPSVRPEPAGLLGGFLVTWEFMLPIGDVQAFHDFLRANETYIGASLGSFVKSVGRSAHACYHGTYSSLSPGETKYWTIWAYDSPETMHRVWSAVIRDRNSKFYRTVRQLRAFWLRDPNRRDRRHGPARVFFDPKSDGGDAFGKLTLDAEVLNARARRRS